MLVIVVVVRVFSTFCDASLDFLLVMFDVFVVKYVVFEALSRHFGRYVIINTRFC